MVWPLSFHLFACVIQSFLVGECSRRSRERGRGRREEEEEGVRAPEEVWGLCCTARPLQTVAGGCTSQLKYFHVLLCGLSNASSLSLQIPGSKGYMFKMELQTEAQHLCDKSFTVVSEISFITQPTLLLLLIPGIDLARRASSCAVGLFLKGVFNLPSLLHFVCMQPDLGSKYTAWSSVSTLIQKNLVIKTHNPARYTSKHTRARKTPW